MIAYMTVNIVCEIMSTMFFLDPTFVLSIWLICSSVYVLGQKNANNCMIEHWFYVYIKMYNSHVYIWCEKGIAKCWVASVIISINIECTHSGCSPSHCLHGCWIAMKSVGCLTFLATVFFLLFTFVPIKSLSKLIFLGHSKEEWNEVLHWSVKFSSFGQKSTARCLRFKFLHTVVL
jgi:hypothetical protein